MATDKNHLKIHENAFRDYSVCPLKPAAAEPEELEAARLTAKWLFGEVYNDRLPRLSEVRTHINQHTASRLGGRACRRLHDLAVNYHILQPVTAYELAFARVTVQGAYAVVAKPRRRDRPLLLRFRWMERNQQLPDVVSLCRWLHFRFHEAGLPDVKILNYSLSSDESWTETFEEAVVRDQLLSISRGIADGLVYPSVSPGCLDCSQPCMVALRG